MPKRSEFGKNWWAKRWIEALEAFGWTSRLQRGRTYARGGRVRALEVAGSAVSAKVQGSEPTPYRVSIHVQPLTAEQWQRVLERFGSQALFAAKLLAGEMPPDVEEVFDSVGVPLFPSSTHDLKTGCTCPDWANPCKHIAAVHYVLGEEFDRDPFLLFELRGRTKGEILEALRARRAEGEVPAPAAQPSGGGAPEAEGPPLEASPDRFWDLGEDLSPLLAAPVPGRGVEGVMRILGTPPFAREGLEIADALAAAYTRVSKRALRVAYGGDHV